jgi:thiol-disulfide isomerase/thioredoxin
MKYSIFYLKMILVKVFCTLLLLPIYSSGQSTNNYSTKNAISYRTRFYDFYHSNPDSALHYAKKMADDPLGKPFMREMIHEDFFMMFHERTKQKYKEGASINNHPDFEAEYEKWINVCYTTLVKMGSDNNPNLANSVQPLLYWVNVEINKDNPQKLEKMINEFIATQLLQNHLYQNASARYALYIYEAVAEIKELEGLAEKLLSTTITSVSSLQTIENVYFSSKSFLEERAWNRYILSCASNMMAKRLLQKGDHSMAGIYYKKSFDFAPDITDLRNPTYLVDSYFLSDGENGYLQTDYLNYLENDDGNKSQILSSYVDLALKDPVTYKEKLYQVFKTLSEEDESFSDFWLRAVDSYLEEAPPVDLQKVGGGAFSSLESAGKWILIDFWGTWCGPCREEHPILQKFNDDLVLDPNNKLELFTVACNDSEEKVISYMEENNYSFPVAMSDGNIEEAFNIHGYPTKVLITPQGKYLIIPLGVDWINFIKQYAAI